MSTTLVEAPSITDVARDVFVAGNANLSAPEVRAAVARLIKSGISVEELRGEVREQVVKALTNRGDKTDAESVDKKFMTNGYQRPILLGALIAQGVDPVIVATFTSVGWADIESALATSNPVEILSEKAELIATQKEADKQARKNAAAAVQTTAPAFLNSLINLDEVNEDADRKVLSTIYALLKDKLGK